MFEWSFHTVHTVTRLYNITCGNNFIHFWYVSGWKFLPSRSRHREASSRNIVQHNRLSEAPSLSTSSNGTTLAFLALYGTPSSMFDQYDDFDPWKLWPSFWDLPTIPVGSSTYIVTNVIVVSQYNPYDVLVTQHHLRLLVQLIKMFLILLWNRNRKCTGRSSMALTLPFAINFRARNKIFEETGVYHSKDILRYWLRLVVVRFVFGKNFSGVWTSEKKKLLTFEEVCHHLAKVACNYNKHRSSSTIRMTMAACICHFLCQSFPEVR